MAHPIPAPAKAVKAARAADCTALEQIPNIGVALAADLRSIGRSVSNLTGGISGFEKALRDNVLLEAMRSTVGAEQGGLDQAARANRVQQQFQFLKDHGVNDPDVDMFLALGASDREALQDAIDRGADINTTDTKVLGRYAPQLKAFEP